MRPINSLLFTRFNTLTVIFGLVLLLALLAMPLPAALLDTNTSSDYADEYELDENDVVETVVMTTDLLADAKIAAAKKIPILLLFSQESCAYCETVRSEFLRPMLLNADYDNRVLIRQIEYDGDNVLDFNGDKVEMPVITDRYNVGFTPTVIFIDSRGKELTEQLIGITTVHFYGGFLDDNIDLALKKIRDKKAITALSHK